MELKLGIEPPSSSTKPSDPNLAPDVFAGKKRRFDDTEYLEQSRDLKDGVKNAVAAALLKKKKAKLSHSNDSSNNDVTERSKDKVPVKSVAIPVVPTTAVALDAVGA